MQLGETIATYDVALALRGESGKFEVTSPTGEVYHVTCTPNHSISNLEWSGNKTEAQPFLIRKVAEPVPEQGKTAASGAAEGQARETRTPFLLEHHGESKPSTGDGLAPLSKERQEDLAIMELFYTERDDKNSQPSALVCLKMGKQDTGIKRRMTAACASFNEFDAEIRKLHAELEQIRAHARKKFYKTHAAAASA